MYGHKLDAYEVAAKTVNVGTSTIRSWVIEFEAQEYIADSRRGKHSKTESPNLEDLKFREEFKCRVRETSREQVNIF